MCGRVVSDQPLIVHDDHIFIAVATISRMWAGFESLFGGPSGSPRLPQDQNVNPVPPDSNDGDSVVGPNANQNAQAQADAADARAQGATDIRMNQQQVNAQGERVGVNRPDLQYTLNGKRYYIEYESTNPGAGPYHQGRITSNDPNAIVVVKQVK